MKTPDFWYRKAASWQQILLQPFAFLYGLGRALHVAAVRPRGLGGVHVICAGNATAGGAGKTPVAIALMALLQQSALVRSPVFVLRGYKGSNDKPMRVDSAKHSAADVGEEALLLARHAPVYVGRNRYDTAHLAKQDGADVIVLDDGLQNRHLRPDTALMVVDAAMGFGNASLIPAGPLREPLSAAKKRCAAAVVIGDAPLDFDGKPVFTGAVQPQNAAGLDKSLRYFAFAGIGYPQKFYAMLRDLGATVARTQSFADHHHYSRAEVAALQNIAQAEGLTLITTEKDMANLQQSEADVSAVQVLPVAFSFANQADFVTWLEGRLQQ